MTSGIHELLAANLVDGPACCIVPLDEVAVDGVAVRGVCQHARQRPQDAT
jgi:hypothetical protein